MIVGKKRLAMIVVVCVILVICLAVIYSNMRVLQSVVWIDGDVSEIERIELSSERYGENTITDSQDIKKLIGLISASKAKKIISYSREGDVDTTNATIAIRVFFYDGTSQKVRYGMYWKSMQKSNFPDMPNLIISKRNVALEEFLTEILDITEPAYP